MITLVRSTLKLLFRTKAFWFFLLLMPILSTFILKNKFDSSAAYIKGNEEKIRELEYADDKVAYFGGKGEYIIKVYDASESELSDALLDKLAKSGMFHVCRVRMKKLGLTMDRDFMDSRIKKDGYEDRMGASIFIDPDFDEKAVNNASADAITLVILSDDSRNEALEAELTARLTWLDQSPGRSAGEIAGFLKEMDENIPQKEIISVSGKEGIELNQKQTNQRAQMGYAFAFLTLGFVFCGIIVAHTAITEQKNGVLTRVDLAGVSELTFFAAKFICVSIVSVMVTGVMALCSLFLNMEDLGMHRGSFLFMIFLMGLIFGALSLLFGILMGDVMSANVAAFTIWCLSALMSGLYFPLNYTTKALKVMSLLMPQKWFLTGTEMIFVGDNKAYGMLICVTVAYLAVILSLGGLGLKIRGTEEWGNT